MGLSWPSLGRWTSRRTQAPEHSLEPLRLTPVGRATKTTLCYSPSDGHQSSLSSHSTPYDEAFPSSSSTPSTDEHHRHHLHHRQEQQECPTSSFKVQTHGVEETEAILRGESSRALVALRQRQEEAERRLRSEGSEANSNFWERAVSVARRRGEEKTAALEQQQQQQQWWRRQKERRHGDEDGRYHHDRRGRYTDVEPGEGCGGAKEVNPLGHWEELRALDGNAGGADAERRSSMWRESLARTEKVPRLPSLLFPEFGKMVAEVGIPSTHGGSDASPVHGHHGDGTGTATSLDESPKSMNRLLECPYDSAEVIVGGGQVSAEQSMRDDGLDMHRPATEDFEGWQMNEENKSPHGPTGYDILRPATGLGWYDGDEWSLRSTIDHFSAEPDGHWTDERSIRTITVKTQHFPVRKDSLHYSSPIDHEFSSTVSSTEIEDNTLTEEDVSAGPSPSMSTIINNSSAFLQSSTEDDDDDDDWLGPRRKIQSPVSYNHVEYRSSANDGPSSSSLSHSPNFASPASSGFSPLSCEEEQDIDDLLDIYAATASSDPIPSVPSTHENDVLLLLLPPWLPYHPSAAAPLATIARGLSLPPTTPFDVLQDHLARNANILRYLVLHCIPSPSTNPVEQANDLVEPILPPPLAAHPSFAENYPQHPRRREYTRLLQAVRSVRWSAGAIVDMLAVVDFPQTAPLPSFSSPGRSLRPSTALPMFRKLRTADAQRKGCLTSAQLHSLHRHGVSLLDVLQMNDVPKAAESSALCIARDCNLLDEEGALLDLLADPDEPPLKSPGCERRVAVGKGSGLRNCVDVNGDDEDDEMDGNEIRGHDRESVARDSEAAEHAIDDDAPYIVSPLSPEATTNDHGWDHQQGDVSPLAASHRTQDLEALLHHVRPLSSTRDGQAGEDEKAAPTSPWIQHSYELGAAAAASAVVDGDALEDPAVRVFMQDMGFGVDDFRLALGDRTSWGVDLGGMLSE
ncbi:hypothetical protein CH063_06510 [Colletotrichum higginsianum]|uniref:Uncharacterized protein n=1 Tax=Colletotrichum higginsianum (strain IMI 349063) TaxID=759273 RepID=H1V2T0_COLHI|nr:hypothetical protein CH063_06510 [Colletotrichum higginsianum]